MKKQVTQLRFTCLFFTVMCFWGSIMSQECNPPGNIVSTKHSPKWYNVNLIWDIPNLGASNSQQSSQSGQDALANEFIYATAASPRSFYKSTLGNPASDTFLTDINASNGALSMIYANGRIYYVDSNKLFGTTTYRFYEMEVNTWTPKLIMSYNAKYGVLPYLSSITWNPMSDKFYVSSWGTTESSDYGLLDITDGSYTKLGLLDGTYALAIDNMGVCYGIAMGNPGKFGTIDLKTGVFTKIADIPFNVSYLQDISIDRATNELYWIARELDNTNNCPFYKINKNTGALDLIGTLPYNQISAFSVMNELGNTNPFKFNVYRDGVKLTPEPIIPAHFSDLVPGPGTYTYEIEAVYENCISPKVEHTVVMEQDECEIPIQINPYPFEEYFEEGTLSNKCWTQEKILGDMLWEITEGDTHSGYYKIVLPYAYDETGSSETKLIMPYIDISATPNPTLSFWHRQKARENTYDVPYTHQDTLRVYYRTELNGNWVLLKEYKDEIVDWTEEAITLPNPSSHYQIAFDAYSISGIYVLEGGVELDDIYVGTTSTCLAPTNLTASTSQRNVSLAWNAPEDNGEFQSYNLYKDSIFLANVTETSYTDENVIAGMHSYCVEAVYNNLCGVSPKVWIDEPVFIANECGNQVDNISSFLYQPEENNVVLNWDSPASTTSGERISYNENYSLDNVIGTPGGTQIAVKWEANELENMNGKYLSAIRFVPNVTTPYSIRVWEGGSEYDPGKLIVDKQVPVSGLKLFEWNEIPLGKSFKIDSTKELWIGLYNENILANEAPMLANGGPIVEVGKSNLIYYENRWQPLSFIGAAYTYNWAITGVVKDSEALIGYNIFRDGQQLNDDIWVANTYTDLVPEKGNYTYGISSVWANFCMSAPKEHAVTVGENPCNTALSLPLDESFDDEHFPILCWKNESENNIVWQRVDEGTFDKNVVPHSGSGMLEYRCNYFSEGKLVTPLLAFDKDAYTLSFWLYRDNNTDVNRINVYLTDDGDTSEKEPVLTAYRCSTCESQTNTGWYKYEVKLDCSDMETGRIVFEAVSHGSSKPFLLDDISVKEDNSPIAEITPAAWNANKVTLGTSANSGEFILKNGGTGNLSVSGITNLENSPWSTTFGDIAAISLAENEEHTFNFNFTPSALGNFEQQFEIITNGGTKTITLTGIGISNSGIDETGDSPLVVYPNPTKGILFIENSASNVGHIIISNAIGKVYIDKIVENNKIELDMSLFTNGVYFLNVNGKIIKVVKQ